MPARLGVADCVVFTGEVPDQQLPAHYDAGDVFAMPCRSRMGGLDVEGLGIVYLEASATGLPVIAGDSGGAPDAVVEGETGYVVPGRDVAALADRLSRLLEDPEEARAMGARGRTWTERHWHLDMVARRFRLILEGALQAGPAVQAPDGRDAAAEVAPGPIANSARAIGPAPSAGAGHGRNAEAP